MPFFKYNRIVHWYLDEGARHLPAVIFASSLGSDLRIWDDVAARLTSSCRVVRYDKRGHGLTEAAPPPYSAEALADDVVALLEELKIERAVICGVSVGGVIAQALALGHPRRVRGLVLCDTGARIGTVDSWQQRIDRVQANGLASLEETTMERWFSAGFRGRRPADLRGYGLMLRQTSTDGYIGTCAALRDADFRGRIGAVQCPTLVLCGSEDMSTPPELGRELAGLIRGARFSLIQNAAHLPCIEQPEAAAERILEIFREVKLV